MRILVVEDDPKIAGYVSRGLRQEGYVVDVVPDGNAALEHSFESNYDALVLDILLPKRGGLSVIEELRRSRVRTPILVLSARSSIDDKVRTLRAGGDDYITKPFSFSELVARLEALIRRSADAGMSRESVLTCADLSLDRISRRVRRGDTRLELQPKEFALLDYFLSQQGRVLTKTLILEQVWDCGFDPQTNVVDVLVCRLRNKVDRDFEPKLIHTLRGVGYVLREN
jgi:two-component system OmpR family response regulator